MFGLLDWKCSSYASACESLCGVFAKREGLYEAYRANGGMRLTALIEQSAYQATGSSLLLRL